jgi:hypothetical protein
VDTVKSASAKLTVIEQPYASPTKPMKSLSLVEGKNASLSTSIRGGKPMTYVWKKNGVVIDGENKNKLSRVGITAGDAGTYSVTVTNPAGTETEVATLTVIAASTVAKSGARVELDEHSLLSSVEDADDDGLSNLLEHALGSDPTSSGSAHSPLVDSVEDGTGDSYISFSYTENNSATGIAYVVERSTDLKIWEPVNLSNTSVNRVDRGTLTEVTLYIPATDGSGFFRVRVE